MINVLGKTIKGPNLVLSGLDIYLDAANIKSYPGSGTTLSDLGRNAYSATLVNGVTWDVANYGNFLFDGTNDYIQTNYIRTTPTTTAFTYQILFKNLENANYNGLLGRSTYASSGISIALMFTNRIMISLNGASANTELEFNYQNSDITLGTFVFNGRAVSVYRNKQLVYSNSIAFDPVTDSNPIRIGGDIQGGWGFANKRVYSFLAYNKVFTASDVSQNWLAFKSRFGLSE
jgi:hypothetical protein